MDVALPPKKPRLIGRWLTIILVLAGIMLWWISSQKDKETVADLPLQWQQVQRGTVNFTANGVGELYASEQRTLSALETGYVADVIAKVGDTVEVGDVLMLIQNPQLQLELEAAQSDLRSADLQAKDAILRLNRELAEALIQIDNAKADLEVALSEFNSYQQLLEINSVSKLQYEQALARHRKSQNSLDAALRLHQLLSAQQQQMNATWQENLKLAALRANRMQQRVDSLTIRASQPGIIKDLFITAGDGIVVGSRLGVIGPELPDSARLQFPQRYSQQLKTGTKVDLNLLGKTAHGFIVRISPDLTQGAVLAEVSLTNTPATARIGMAVRADAQLGEQQNALFIKTAFEADVHNQVRVWRHIAGNIAPQTLSNVTSFNGYMVFNDEIQEGENIAIDPRL